MTRPRLVSTGRADGPADPRVAAVLEVLGGSGVAEVAQRWSMDSVLLRRWVRAFVDAGTAQVTNRPDPDAANQRDRFLAAFAHEMRTPLAVAQGWAAMLLEGDVPPAVHDSSVRRLHEALGRLAERTLDVELLAAASLGRLRLVRERVTVAQLASELDGHDESDLAGGELEIEVDPGIFRRVLRDLWDAGSIAPRPRSVRLVVEEVAPWVELRVVREGDPIDHHVLQALFDPFDLNDDGTGVTIGLYLARALTVAHGGTVGVSQTDGGAAFWVRVPINTGSSKGKP